MASGLIQWGISHSGTHICVLTRAVGHSPALLPNFFHSELQPLQDSDIRKIATELISAVEQNESVRGPLIEQFLEAVKTTDSRTAAAIAARNPLLLSFLVRLFLDHQPLTGNRSALFSRIIELIRKSSPTDRRSIHGTTVSYGEAWEIAEILGWIAIESPGRTAEELYHEITNRSEHNGIGLNAAESGVSFWEDRGLIERVSVGSRDTIVFVHLSLGEYLAACFIARSGPDFVRSETIRLRRRAKWREPLLLSAGLSGGEEVSQFEPLPISQRKSSRPTRWTFNVSSVSERLTGSLGVSASSNGMRRPANRLTEESARRNLCPISASEIMRSSSRTRSRNEATSAESSPSWPMLSNTVRSASRCPRKRDARICAYCRSRAA